MATKRPVNGTYSKEKKYYSVYYSIKPHGQSWDVNYVPVAIFILFECLTVINRSYISYFKVV